MRSSGGQTTRGFAQYQSMDAVGNDTNFDPYAVLHLNPADVDLDKLKTAYGNMAVLYHPDKNKGNMVMFNKIKKAHIMILDKLKGKGSQTYVHAAIKDSFAQFKAEQERTVPPTEMITEASVTDLSDSNGARKFDLKEFNETFIMKAKAEKDIPIPIDAKDEDFDSKKESFYKEKTEIDNDITKINPLFAKTCYDRNVFNRCFDHINGSISSRSTELATYTGVSEPMALTSCADKFAFIDEKESTVTAGVDIDAHYSVLDALETLKNNPSKIESRVKEDFAKLDDITKSPPVDKDYLQIINRRLQELKRGRAPPPQPPSS